jgi:hypothetical protein
MTIAKMVAASQPIALSTAPAEDRKGKPVDLLARN